MVQDFRPRLIVAQANFNGWSQESALMDFIVNLKMKEMLQSKFQIEEFAWGVESMVGSIGLLDQAFSKDLSLY